jgi:hypothetical protein
MPVTSPDIALDLDDLFTGYRAPVSTLRRLKLHKSVCEIHFKPSYILLRRSLAKLTGR